MQLCEFYRVILNECESDINIKKLTHNNYDFEINDCLCKQIET